MHAPPFPYVIHPWGRFLAFLLYIDWAVSHKKITILDKKKRFRLSCLFKMFTPFATSNKQTAVRAIHHHKTKPFSKEDSLEEIGRGR